MKSNLKSVALIVVALGLSACAENDDDENEIQSFSHYVRDVFDESANEEPESVIEGEEFQFEAADQLETYSDLLSK